MDKEALDRLSISIQKVIFETEMRINSLDSRIAEMEESILTLRAQIRELQKK